MSCSTLAPAVGTSAISTRRPDLLLPTTRCCRLTVAANFGLIGAVTTGFLGVDLLTDAEAPMWRRIALFVATLAPRDRPRGAGTTTGVHPRPGMHRMRRTKRVEAR
jgi:hypothetical protein